MDVVLITGYPAFRASSLQGGDRSGQARLCGKPPVDSAGIRSVLETAAEAKKKPRIAGRVLLEGSTRG